MKKPGLFAQIVCAGALFAITTWCSTTVAADEQKTAVKAPAPAKVAKQPDPSMLNPEQRKAFQNISKEMHENMRAGQALHEEIRALTQSDAYTEKKVRELVQKRHKEAEESMVKSSREMHDFYKTLTPEQKKRFAALHEQMKERQRNEMKSRIKDRDTKQTTKKPATETPDPK